MWHCFCLFSAGTINLTYMTLYVACEESVELTCHFQPNLINREYVRIEECKAGKNKFNILTTNSLRGPDYEVINASVNASENMYTVRVSNLKDHLFSKFRCQGLDEQLSHLYSNTQIPLRTGECILCFLLNFASCYILTHFYPSPIFHMTVTYLETCTLGG